MKMRRILNAFVFVIVMVSWISMITGKEGILASRGIRSLRYFTVLSNLLAAFAALLWQIRPEGTAARRIKYAAAVSVGLTFLTVLVFLGPLFGYAGMYSGANFWFHLMVPLICMLEILLLSREPLSRRDNLLSVLPMLFYGIFYLGNILLNGRQGNDWYGFITWGMPAGIGIFLLIIAVTYGIGWGLRKGKEQLQRIFHVRDVHGK